MRCETDGGRRELRLVPGSTVLIVRGWNEGEGNETTHMKYSKASSLAFRMSYRSRPMSTRLVGSRLYGASDTPSSSHGYTPAGVGEMVSGTGPTTREGQMTESAFSRWRVSSRPEPVWSDSRDEKDERWLTPWESRAGGDTEGRDLCLRCISGWTPRCSSADERGDERAGDERTVSSASDPDIKPASRDAAKLLEISGSETTAYEDCVDAVDVVEIVRSRAERREGRGSSCHTEDDVSTLP